MTPFNSEKIPNIPSKKDRLGQIFNQLTGSKPASTADEASRMVTDAFNRVEESYGIPNKDRMEAYSLDECNKMMYGDHSVRYINYDKHTVFYGDNGSVDVRRINGDNPPTDKTLRENPTFPQDMPRSFEKPGADGKNVWD